MPLLDHFRPPMTETHFWDEIHAAWIAWISDTLNRTLPAGYFATEQSHAGVPAEIDVATFRRATATEAVPDPRWSGGAGPTGWAPGSPAGTGPAAFADDFEVKVVTDRGGGRRLVAAVELVSTRNKDRPESRRAFATKCASYLYQGVAVVVVDVVTERHADLHREVTDLFSPGLAPLPPGTRLYAVAYRPIRRDERDEVEVWAEPLAVGSPLPTLPLWLNAVAAVPLDLEATYTEILARRRIAG